MAYNSAYTGSQIDAAVGAVKQKESTWDGKQDALSGTKGQIVGFEDDGKPVAQDDLYTKAVAAGYTGTESEFYAALVTLQDGPFLPLTGGTLTGDLVLYKKYLRLQTNGTTGSLLSALIFSDNSYTKGDLLVSEDVAVVNITRLQVNLLLSMNNRQIISLGDPTEYHHAANKYYVDTTVDAAKPKAVPVTLTASGWVDGVQTVTVSGVSADENAQEIRYIYPGSSAAAVVAAGLYISATAENSVTFSCFNDVPTADIAVCVEITEINYVA